MHMLVECGRHRAATWRPLIEQTTPTQGKTETPI